MIRFYGGGTQKKIFFFLTKSQQQKQQQTIAWTYTKIKKSNENCSVGYKTTEKKITGCLKKKRRKTYRWIFWCDCWLPFLFFYLLICYWNSFVHMVNFICFLLFFYFATSSSSSNSKEKRMSPNEMQKKLIVKNVIGNCSKTFVDCQLTGCLFVRWDENRLK